MRTLKLLFVAALLCLPGLAHAQTKIDSVAIVKCFRLTTYSGTQVVIAPPPGTPGACDTTKVFPPVPLPSIVAVTMTPDSAAVDTGGTVDFRIKAAWSDGLDHGPALLSMGGGGGSVQTDTGGLFHYKTGATPGQYLVTGGTGTIMDSSIVTVRSPPSMLPAPANVSLTTRVKGSGMWFVAKWAAVAGATSYADTVRLNVSPWTVVLGKAANAGLNDSAFVPVTFGTAPVSYFVCISAAAGAGTRSPNGCNQTVFCALCNPSDVVVNSRPDTTTILVSWKINSSAHTGFELQRANSVGGTYATVAWPLPTATSSIRTGITAGTQYCYRIRARYDSVTVAKVGPWSAVDSTKSCYFRPIKVAYFGNYIWPRDTVKLTSVLYTPSCDTAKAVIDTLAGTLKIGCNWAKKAGGDSGVAATIQMCQVSIYNDGVSPDTVVRWTTASKNLCAKDSVMLRLRYGSKFRPDLPADDSLYFAPLLAKQSFK